MFLNSLNHTEKENFMKLAVAIIKADGTVEESEKQILTAYAHEMQIPVHSLEVLEDTDKIIRNFAMNATDQIKRIVFVELLALALADGNYVPEEQTLIQQLADAFGFDRNFIEQAIYLEDAYISVYRSLVHLVEKGE